MVEGHDAVRRGEVRHDRDVGIAADLADQIARRVFPPVDLAALKRRRSRKWVEGQPLDPVEMRHLGPRGEAASPGRPLSRAWPVLRKTLKHDAGAADMFVLQVAERAARVVFERFAEYRPRAEIGRAHG